MCLKLVCNVSPPHLKKHDYKNFTPKQKLSKQLAPKIKLLTRCVSCVFISNLPNITSSFCLLYRILHRWTRTVDGCDVWPCFHRPSDESVLPQVQTIQKPPRQRRAGKETPAPLQEPFKVHQHAIRKPLLQGDVDLLADAWRSIREESQPGVRETDLRTITPENI